MRLPPYRYKWNHSRDCLLETWCFMGIIHVGLSPYTSVWFSVGSLSKQVSVLDHTSIKAQILLEPLTCYFSASCQFICLASVCSICLIKTHTLQMWRAWYTLEESTPQFKRTTPSSFSTTRQHCNTVLGCNIFLLQLYTKPIYFYYYPANISFPEYLTTLLVTTEEGVTSACINELDPCARMSKMW